MIKWLRKINFSPWVTWTITILIGIGVLGMYAKARVDADRLVNNADIQLQQQHQKVQTVNDAENLSTSTSNKAKTGALPSRTTWRIYTNTQYGYSISYPTPTSEDIGPTPQSGLLIQYHDSAYPIEGTVNVQTVNKEYCSLTDGWKAETVNSVPFLSISIGNGVSTYKVMHNNNCLKIDLSLVQIGYPVTEQNLKAIVGTFKFTN